MTLFAKPIQIRDLTIKNRVFLAPLAGVSDIPFRRICQEYGVGLTYVEMLSAKAINYNSRRTWEMMARHSSEEILGVQVTGPDPEEVSNAITKLDKEGFEAIDLNMGCPVKKVVKNNCGSGLLRDQQNLRNIVDAARGVTQKALSVKVRLGFTRDDINILETANNVYSAGADMFTIHGRTRNENYSKPVDYKGIASGVEATKTNSSVVTVGNGDIFDYQSALKMQKESNCDAIMVSRGALGNPWIFKEILAGKTIQPTIAEWFDVVMRHLNYQEEHYGDSSLGVGLMKKQLIWYAKGYPMIRNLREKLPKITSLSEARELFKNYAKEIPSHLERYCENEKGKTVLPHWSYDPKYEMDRKLDRGVGDDLMSVSGD